LPILSLPMVFFYDRSLSRTKRFQRAASGGVR
jgi:hypothetical protein